MMEPTKIGSLKKIFDVGGGWAAVLRHLSFQIISLSGDTTDLYEATLLFPNDLSVQGTQEEERGQWHF